MEFEIVCSLFTLSCFSEDALSGRLDKMATPKQIGHISELLLHECTFEHNKHNKCKDTVVPIFVKAP
ncbi:unnamed protein product [Xylocopa violacea]|uniref:Uncharacterized protein n=1 Tax=Xylocopa violacea TaxID=135666 RepID=A0ABP1PHU9_XYLVO